MTGLSNRVEKLEAAIAPCFFEKSLADFEVIHTPRGRRRAFAVINRILVEHADQVDAALIPIGELRDELAQIEWTDLDEQAKAAFDAFRDYILTKTINVPASFRWCFGGNPRTPYLIETDMQARALWLDFLDAAGEIAKAHLRNVIDNERY